MEKFDIHNWQKKYLSNSNKLKNNSGILKEVHNPSGTASFNKLVKLLQASVQQAKLVHQDGQDNREDYEGTEGVDVGLLLEQVWNAFSTGDENDNSEREEIFK